MLDSDTSRSFTSDVLKLVTGTVVAQVITIIAAPLLTRLYGPEAFGIQAVFMSIASIIGVIICLRYELAIMLPNNDIEASNLLGLCLLIVAIISGLIAIIIYFSGNLFLSFLGAEELKSYLYLLPLFIFVSGIFLALNYWNSRTRNFGRLSIAKVTSAIGTTSTQLGAGFSGYANGGSLITANIVGSTISTTVLGMQICKDDYVLFKKNISLQVMLKALKRYKKFPLIDSISALLNSITWQMPVLILTKFFSQIVVGFYFLALSVIQLPMSLIGSAIAQVFFQRASEANKEGNLKDLMENIFDVLLKISIFPLLLLAITGQEIFLVIFGAEWGESGLYAQILSFWIITWFLYSPLSTIYIVLEKQSYGLIFNLVNFILRFFSLVIGGIFGNVYIAIGLFSLSGVIIYSIFCYILLMISGVTTKFIINTFLMTIKLSILPLTIILLIKYFTFSNIVIFIFSVLFLVFYYLYLLKTDKKIRYFLINSKS